MARGLTDIAIRNLKPGKVRREIPDPGQHGLYVVVQPSGHKSFAVRYRCGGKPRKMTLQAGISLAAARKATADALHKLSLGSDPGALEQQRKDAERKAAHEAAGNTFQAVADNYLRREGSKLRSEAWRRGILERLVFPTLGPRPVHEVRRRDIVELLDKIEDERGPVMADRTLAVVRKLFNWHAARDEDFRTPIVRGMARTKPKERARDRVLTDDELRAIWKAAEAGQGPFERLVQFLLLTAARRNEAAQMRWSEIDGTGWTLPAARNKVKVDLIRPLSDKAQNVLAKVHRLAGCAYVFSTNGRSPISGYDYFKRRLDAASGVSHWTLHDLRRTARSLMSRAGINSDHAECCLGHVILGVRGVYDRHDYYREKQQAFEELAALIERIVNPSADNIVSLGEKRAAQ